jgi:galactose mutarotase-like enzyme
MMHGLVSIHSADVSAEIALFGAELRSFQPRGGENVLWDVDSQFWNRVAPHLFPIVGRLKNDQYHYQGVQYAMKQHGFARDQSFEVLEHTESEVLLGLRSSEETQAMYPFDFQFQVRYRIEGKVLWVDYVTKNLGDTPMLYSVGGHPGFGIKGPIEGYVLRFSRDGQGVSFEAERRLIEGGYYTGETRTVVVSEGVLPLETTLFAQDAIVFNEPLFDTVSLEDVQGKTLLDFYCWEWDAVGFWTKPGAPFFCIEPWWGWADDVDSTGDFALKAGLHRLEVGDSETVTYGLGLR